MNTTNKDVSVDKALNDHDERKLKQAIELEFELLREMPYIIREKPPRNDELRGKKYRRR